MEKQHNIACYLSTHGYGHAVRSSELIYQLALQKKKWKFFIISGTAEAIFHMALSLPNVFLRKTTVDFGLIQNDPRKFCLEETARKLEDLITDFGAITEREKSFLKRECITALFCDIPFLPFEAADALNIPSIGMGNFSWDWIYYYYKPFDPVFERAAQLAFSCYQKCGLYLELPQSPPPKAFSNRKKIPLVCRKTSKTKKAAKELLNIKDDKKLFLIGFSQLQLSEKARKKISALKNYRFIIPPPLKLDIDNGITISDPKIAFPTIAKACDGIISKPGYGIISDAISANIPLIETERGDFPEIPYLEKLLNTTVGSIKISKKHFENGRWKKALKKAQRLKMPPPQEHNGTESAIHNIISYLDK